MSRVTFCAICYVCRKSFRSYRSFLKHVKDRHVENVLIDNRVKFVDQGKEVEIPTVKLLEKHDLNGYLSWLTGVTEQINASLHPCLPGK